jgi:LmbE family N-acetylglucosaminyl deacetylase
LPDVRERELRCACQAYGIHPPLFLDYVDGQLTIVHQGQAVGKLVRVIRELRPQVVLTFGPDGVYGHYDHIAVHRWATIAVDLAADPACFPDGQGEACEPFEISKLYYLALPEEQVAQMAQQGMRSVMMDGVPFPFVGRPKREITTVIDVGDYAETKLKGILCHATQLAEEEQSPQAIEDSLGSEAFCTEHFVLARSAEGWPDGVEGDLFCGIG